MVRVTDELALTPEHVTLYYTNDPLLGHLPFLIFHGPSTTANYTLNSSRIQIHVFSPAGFQSYPRITVSPNSPFYSVVSHLPREFQGDEVWRGLAFGLYKYFTELPEAVKYYLKKQYPSRGHRPGSGPALFSEQHAADLAKSMVRSDNTAGVINVLQSALQTQHISNIDIDLVLPPWSITPLNDDELAEVPEDEDDLLDPTLRQYGAYSPLVKMWGEPVFLPTSKLRRAPSRPTSLNRGRSFTKHQKVELRMKLGELVDTEERYVMKLNELVNHIAEEFRQTARSRPPGSISPSEDEVNKLFPESADRILQLNSGFVQELRRVMDETEETAVRDFESAHGGVTRVGSSARSKDPSGALSVARIFLEWFPKFTESYQDYIRASQHFPQLLNSFLDKQSSFRQRVAQKGEQTVRSILIEPVQRLPRYSLLIDQIVGCIPITHPALQLMLRARDIITNICSMDEPLVDKPHVTNLLRNMIESWPLDLEPQGRLILAADFVELAPPFNYDMAQFVGQDTCGILLLFSDCVTLVRKKSSSSPTGRELVRETDKPSPAGLLASMTNAAGGPESYELEFIGWHHLSDVRFTESVDGRWLWMTSTREMKAAQTGDGTSKAVTSRCLVLQENFEGKAAKVSEDIVKARVEGRFSERERETPAWTLRSVRMPDSNLGMYAAVFQEAAEQLVEGRREPAPIRIVVDNDKGTKGHPVGHYGVEIVTEIRSGDLRRIRMTTLGLNGKQYTDDVALEDLLPTLSRRIIQLLSTQFKVSNIRLAPALVSYYTKIVRNLAFNSRAEKTRSFMSSSPVKMLSSFLTGSASDVTSQSSPKPRGMLSPPPVITRAESWKQSKESLVESIRSRGSRDTVGMGGDDERLENPLVRLEQTFTGYVGCLESRKGQFVGRLMLNRSTADETTVNDLYNRLIESPYAMEASADVSTETIFVTFEKFVRIAWREQMGPVMSSQHLDLLLERASRRVPGDFGDFVRYLFNEMAPQNRRAFTSLIKLLASLLDGCSNDSDRGALTLAFAELLVDDGSAHNYINLLDRLVEDCDRIFEDPLAALQNSLERSCAYESMNSMRSYKSGSGSLTSNTSSLRRKFGFDNLLRQNSKNEGDRSSVWRTLSKHGRHPASGDSLGRSAVNRSQSIDNGVPAVPAKLRRPGSYDRPRVAGAFDDMHVRPPSAHRPGSSHRLESGLETIGEPETEMLEPPRSLKKKRRSSLSDLKNLMDTAPVEEPQTMPLNISKQTSEKFNSAPRIPAPSKIPTTPSSKSSSPPAISKIPVTPQSQSLRTPRAREPPGTEPLRNVFASPHPPSSSIRRKHAKTLSTSNIPSLKPTRLPMAGRGSPVPTDLPRPSTSTGRTSAQRLKLQSPQRLRERMETEKKAIEDVGSGLKTELSRISQDMARVNGTPRTSTGDVRRLSNNVKTLEDRIPQVLQELDQRQKAIQEDMEATVKASEAKVKAIDQMYKEATAENELLYEKFNSELGKIVKALRGKGREDREELLVKLRDSSEETAYVKKENARLRREIVSLRALLKSGATRDD
ncbi:Rho guanine nucleotide exchange factor gef2 [Cytospora mali]|uniref:Rho guanine nucleotide exchange factor gef2 n=1 Tax=Cytospora mali TaxID=578113 RepID=A0A194VXJ8_CYTMA|nr:Rho guanine nucleotide exchange factor gef2 [Valsa mali]